MLTLGTYRNRSEAAPKDRVAKRAMDVVTLFMVSPMAHPPEHEPHYDIDFNCAVQNIPFVARFSWSPRLERYAFDRFIPVEGGPAFAGEAVSPADIPAHLLSFDTFHCQHCLSKGYCVRCGHCHQFICGGTLAFPADRAPYFACPCGEHSEVAGIIDRFAGTRHESAD